MDQVYVYEVEDGRAASWTAEIAVQAESPASALRVLRDAGLRKSQFHGSARPTRTISCAEFSDATLGSLRIARRAFEDCGWEPWAPVPAGFALNWRDGEVRVHHPTGGSFRRPHDRG
ncbi:hypothetical protein [Cellulosimicrobium sp. NPDC057127]|uniref:hypothetical protein n=1 Tax=Cellulosimicrobium sp. NPDC057127 TaxID=3346026 RepID=UPI003641AAB1